MTHRRAEELPEPEPPTEPQQFGEALVPVPRFGRGTGLVPLRWVRSVLLLITGFTVLIVQLLAWAFWGREPVASLLIMGGALMGLPVVISMDERRQQQAT